jgi:nicotinamide riboside kinase
MLESRLLYGVGTFYSMKLLIIGHARHGKTTSANFLSNRFNLKFSDSSRAAAEIFLYDKLKDKYGYKDFEECYEDRVNHREEWFDEICRFNEKDPARLAKEIMKTADIYCGMRSNREILKCVEDNVFDYIIFIYNPDLPYEDANSFDIDFDKLPEHYTITNEPYRGMWHLEMQLTALLRELEIKQLNSGRKV